MVGAFISLITMELLYIIRNIKECGSSILGVYTSAALAKEAIERSERSLEKVGYLRMKMIDYLEAYSDYQDGIKESLPAIIPFKEVKVVVPNGMSYRGCSAYSLYELLQDPEGFEKKVQDWFSHQTLAGQRFD